MQLTAFKKNLIESDPQRFKFYQISEIIASILTKTVVAKPYRYINGVFMQNGAYANIRGELKENIVIKSDEDGVICGLIYVLTNDPPEQLNRSQDDNAKPNYIPILLMGVDIIKEYGVLLKKGEKVWLVGELKLAQNSYSAFREFGFGNVSGVIISLHDKTHLRITTHDPAFSIAS